MEDSRPTHTDSFERASSGNMQGVAESRGDQWTQWGTSQPSNRSRLLILTAQSLRACSPLSSATPLGGTGYKHGWHPASVRCHLCRCTEWAPWGPCHLHPDSEGWAGPCLRLVPHAPHGGATAEHPLGCPRRIVTSVCFQSRVGCRHAHQPPRTALWAGPPPGVSGRQPSEPERITLQP